MPAPHPIKTKNNQEDIERLKIADGIIRQLVQEIYLINQKLDILLDRTKPR